ncbi:hypothetical protein ACFJI0_09760 [Hydrogenophaga sp. UC242_53]|uniref:hypothetical protein n=1 Tax=Hydrogenophaga sp. UC242_53 TaxID=3350170 RepID=UPI0036D400AB
MSEGARPPRVLLHAFSTFKLGGPQARFVQLAMPSGRATATSSWRWTTVSTPVSGSPRR